jgi:hypothetical protein
LDIDQPDPEKDEAQQEIEKVLQVMKKWWRKILPRFWASLRQPKFVLEVLGFVVLGIYAEYTIKMYYAGLAQSQFTATTEIESRGPIVFFRGPWFSLVRREDGRTYMRIEMVLESVGETPAVSPIFKWDYSPAPPSETPTYRNSSVTSWQNSVWSNRTTVRDHRDVPMDEARKLANAPFYVYGVIQYTDVFPTGEKSPLTERARSDHRVQWAIKIDHLPLPDRDDPRAKFDPDQWVSPTGSCLDAQCSRYPYEKYKQE